MRALVRRKDQQLTVLTGEGDNSPRPRAPGARLLLRQSAADEPAAAGVGEVQVLCPLAELKGEALANVEPTTGRRGERVLQGAGRRELNRAAIAIGRRVSLEEGVVEQVNLAAVDLCSVCGKERGVWQWVRRNGTHSQKLLLAGNCAFDGVSTVT